MRGLVFIPIAIAAVAGAGAALCQAVGWRVHVRELSVAAVASALVTLAAFAPIFLTRGASQATVAQAGLVATLVHLMAHVAVVAVATLGRLPLGQAFLYWLMPFYWVTLAILATLLARFIRAAVPATGSGAGK